MPRTVAEANQDCSSVSIGFQGLIRSRPRLEMTETPKQQKSGKAQRKAEPHKPPKVLQRKH
jgi:hypothetical protein